MPLLEPENKTQEWRDHFGSRHFDSLSIHHKSFKSSWNAIPLNTPSKRYYIYPKNPHHSPDFGTILTIQDSLSTSKTLKVFARSSWGIPTLSKYAFNSSNVMVPVWSTSTWPVLPWSPGGVPWLRLPNPRCKAARLNEACQKYTTWSRDVLLWCYNCNTSKS